MERTSKLHTRISEIIDIGKLERESRKYLVAGVFLAIFLHTVTGVYFQFIRERPEEERLIRLNKKLPIPIRLITLPSTSTSPFMIRKKQPVRRALTRQAPGERTPGRLPSASRVAPGGETVDVDSLAIYEHLFDYSVPDGMHYIPEGLGLEDDGIQRRERDHVFMTDEMITINDLDTGQYKGLVVIDPNDGHNIRGYVHMPGGIYGATFESRFPLVAFRDYVMSQYTGIEMKFDKPIEVSASAIMKYPFLYITIADQVELTPSEAKNLFTYFENGGFAVIEPDGVPLDNDPCGLPPSTIYVKQMIKDIFQGKAVLKQIPPDHEFFHCYFDVDIKNGYNYFAYKYKRDNSYDCWRKQPRYCLEGIFYKNRLVLVYSEKGYIHGWGENITSALYFGVNCLVYGLLQRGGPTHKLIDVSTVSEQVSRRGWDYLTRDKYRHTEKSSFNPIYNNARPRTRQSR